MKAIHCLAAVLVIVGGLNWGLVALAQFDLVATVAGLSFGETNVLSRIVYALVGIAAVFEAGILLGFVHRHRAHVATA